MQAERVVLAMPDKPTDKRGSEHPGDQSCQRESAEDCRSAVHEQVRAEKEIVDRYFIFYMKINDMFYTICFVVSISNLNYFVDFIGRVQFFF